MRIEKEEGNRILGKLWKGTLMGIRSGVELGLNGVERKWVLWRVNPEEGGGRRMAGAGEWGMGIGRRTR